MLYFKYADSRLKRTCLDSVTTTKRTHTCDSIIVDNNPIVKNKNESLNTKNNDFALSQQKLESNIDKSDEISKKDKFIKKIEKCLSIIPDGMGKTDYMSYLEFNGLSEQLMIDTGYDSVISSNSFTRLSFTINDSGNDNEAYYNSGGEVEARELEDLYNNSFFESFTEEIDSDAWDKLVKDSEKRLTNGNPRLK